MSQNFPRLLLLCLVSGESLSLVEEKPETPNTTGFFFANLQLREDVEAMDAAAFIVVSKHEVTTVDSVKTWYAQGWMCE